MIFSQPNKLYLFSSWNFLSCCPMCNRTSSYTKSSGKFRNTPKQANNVFNLHVENLSTADFFGINKFMGDITKCKDKLQLMKKSRIRSVLTSSFKIVSRAYIKSQIVAMFKEKPSTHTGFGVYSSSSYGNSASDWAESPQSPPPIQ